MTFQNPHVKTEITFLEKMNIENKNFTSCTQTLISFLLKVKLKIVTDFLSLKERNWKCYFTN